MTVLEYMQTTERPVTVTRVAAHTGLTVDEAYDALRDLEDVGEVKRVSLVWWMLAEGDDNEHA